MKCHKFVKCDIVTMVIGMKEYKKRIIDNSLDLKLESFGGVLLENP